MNNLLLRKVNQKLIWGGVVNPYNIRDYINNNKDYEITNRNISDFS